MFNKKIAERKSFWQIVIWQRGETELESGLKRAERRREFSTDPPTRMLLFSKIHMLKS